MLSSLLQAHIYTLGKVSSLTPPPDNWTSFTLKYSPHTRLAAADCAETHSLCRATCFSASLCSIIFSTCLIGGWQKQSKSRNTGHLVVTLSHACVHRRWFLEVLLSPGSDFQDRIRSAAWGPEGHRHPGLMFREVSRSSESIHDIMFDSW